MNGICTDAYWVLGTVIIVANEGSTIDIPNGSILENVVVQGSLRFVQPGAYLRISDCLQVTRALVAFPYLGLYGGIFGFLSLASKKENDRYTLWAGARSRGVIGTAERWV